MNKSLPDDFDYNITEFEFVGVKITFIGAVYYNLNPEKLTSHTL